MAEMKDFKKDFVNRTIDILNRCETNTEYNVTLLLNCLMGLIVQPIEDKKRQKNQDIMQYKSDCVNKLKELSGNTFEASLNSMDDEIFRNIRNSIAHLNVELGCFKGTINKVSFSNKKNGNVGKETLKYTLSVNDLKEFALFVATEYLNRFLETDKGENNKE